MAEAIRLRATVTIDTIAAADDNGLSVEYSFQVSGWDEDANAATDPGLSDEVTISVPLNASYNRIQSAVRNDAYALLVATGLPFRLTLLR